MSKALYLECATGISGDMTVAALLDLGAEENVLRQALASLPLHGYRIGISRVKKAGIDCCDFNVILDEDNHDHDMTYLHGTPEHHHHHQEHPQPLAAHEEHSHHHEDHGHPHHHGRHLSEIMEILDAAALTPNARALAKKIFTILAQAEAKAHALPPEEVHFHEVGAVDSIVDITAAAVCFDSLDIQEVIIPKLCEGSGTVRCQHGVLPIPVPATANIAAAYGLPMEILPMQGELVTPTGAAIAAAVRTGDTLPSPLVIHKIGIGAGKRSYERPSMLRAMLLDTSSSRKDTVWKLETNMDDCTGEALGRVMTLLLEAGARDVHYMPCYMKKNRPAWQLNVLCGEEQIKTMEEIIFRETTTIGIRRCEMQRTVLPREQRTVQTPYGAAVVKICRVGQEERFYPEYDSVAALCESSRQPWSVVFAAVENAARQTE